MRTRAGNKMQADSEIALERGMEIETHRGHDMELSNYTIIYRSLQYGVMAFGETKGVR